MRMRQISFASAEHEGKKRVTRREKFLGEMEQVVPWSRLLEALEPHYPKGARGASADWAGAHAAAVLCAAMVRIVRRGAGRCGERQRGHPAICRYRSGA